MDLLLALGFTEEGEFLVFPGVAQRAALEATSQRLQALLPQAT
jgi:hypothetical protein